MNFLPELWNIMQEARHLDILGFHDLPPTVLNVALHKVGSTCFEYSVSNHNVIAEASDREIRFDTYRNGSVNIVFSLKALLTSLIL